MSQVYPKQINLFRVEEELNNFFPAHTSERTAEGTAHVNANHIKFSGDNKKLMMFWQKPNGNLWLSNEDGRTFGISSYLSARVHDIFKLGIPIEKKMDGNIKRFRLACTCKLIGGNTVNENCWLHSPDKRIV